MTRIAAAILSLLKPLLRWILHLFGGLIAWVRPYTENPDQVRSAWSAATEQVRERAQETRRAVSQRMAILELEHHLNRLYPQVGKTLCDLIQRGGLTLKDDELKTLVDQTWEYRRRLEELRTAAASEGKKTPPT